MVQEKRENGARIKCPVWNMESLQWIFSALCPISRMAGVGGGGMAVDAVQDGGVDSRTHDVRTLTGTWEP